MTDKTNRLTDELGAESSFNDAVDMTLDKTGMLFFVPPETPLQDINEEDVDVVADFSYKMSMREIFKEERDRMKAIVTEHFDQMKISDEESIRLSDDFVFDISEEDLDNLMEAFMEDEFNGEETADGSDETTSGESSSQDTGNSESGS